MDSATIVLERAGRFIPKESVISYLTDSLKGILKNDYDLEEAKEERLKEKYGSID